MVSKVKYQPKQNVDKTIKNRPEIMDGFKLKRKNKIAGDYCVTVNAAEAHMDGGFPVYNLCRTHNSRFGFDTLVDAEKVLTAPEKWCFQCHKINHPYNKEEP